MKPNKQQKRKITEVVKKKDKCVAVSVKKSAHGTGKASQKATETVKISESEPQNQRQIPSAKIKLQLFPISESTRLGLEKDGHNPFLELTLSGGKKISSVVKHLNTKWGSSSVAAGQLMLFPFDTKLEQLASCTRWTLNDSVITAREVYASVGSPSLFRLRYCWCSNTQLEALGTLPKPRPIESCILSLGKSIAGLCEILDVQNQPGKKFDATREEIQREINVNDTLCSDVNEPEALLEPTDMADEKSKSDVPPQSTLPLDDLTNLSIGGLLREISLQDKRKASDFNTDVNKPNWQEIGQISDISIGGLLSESSLLWKINNSNNTESMNKPASQPILLTSSDISIGGLFSEASLLSNIKSKPGAQLVSPWDDGFTSLSIGGLFNEASLQAKAESVGNRPKLLPATPLSTSFGAFFASELNTHSQVPKQTYHEQGLSLLDAEETCHAFPSRKFPSSSTDAIAKSSGANSRPFQLPNAVKNT